MAHGRRRIARELLIASTRLAAESFSVASVTEFLRSGHLGDSSDREEEVMPYDPNLLRSMVESGRL